MRGNGRATLKGFSLGRVDDPELHPSRRDGRTGSHFIQTGRGLDATGLPADGGCGFGVHRLGRRNSARPGRDLRQVMRLALAGSRDDLLVRRGDHPAIESLAQRRFDTSSSASKTPRARSLTHMVRFAARHARRCSPIYRLERGKTTQADRNRRARMNGLSPFREMPPPPRASVDASSLIPFSSDRFTSLLVGRDADVEPAHHLLEGFLLRGDEQHVVEHERLGHVGNMQDQPS
jgi:hypothetical protein